jgi:cytochrome c biogenesis protein CcdA/thiol-disulfide isomerase/thioredoxin
MLLFFVVSFIAGALTVLAPCILPLLPVIIGGSVSGGSAKRAYTVIGSLVASVIVFTLVIKVSSVFLAVPAGAWSSISALILALLGISMLFPKLWESVPGMGALSVWSNKVLGSGMMKKTFAGDVLMGAALGPVFSTCSPTYFVILATVLPANILLGMLYLLAYSLGLGIVLLAISLFGQRFANRLEGLSDAHGWFKRTIGTIFIIVACLIATGYDKALEAWTLNHVFDVTTIERTLLSEASVNPIQAPADLLSQGTYREIVDPSGFINTEGRPIKLSDYVGKKIIMIDFMTYSCINCVRTFPYLIDWNAKYKDKGLLIVGIHTPEFAFEKKQENVEKAMKELGITFPIVLDNNYGTWNAYHNQYWPRKFIIDLHGTIVYDHIGEGGYDETEAVIQELLKTIPGQSDLSQVGTSSQAADMPGYDISPESYIGFTRMEYEATPVSRSCRDADCSYVLPDALPKNQFAFGGVWSVGGESASGGTGSSISYHYVAKKVHVVLGPDEQGSPATLEVYVNGVLSKSLTIDRSDLYTIVDNTEKKEGVVTIRITGGHVLAYAFTFG